nr:cell wall protein RTB1-like [Rhipicephalus microplus]
MQEALVSSSKDDDDDTDDDGDAPAMNTRPIPCIGYQRFCCCHWHPVPSPEITTPASLKQLPSISVSHADNTAAVTTGHAALTSVQGDVHAGVQAITTGTAPGGSVQVAPAATTVHGDSTVTAVHGDSTGVTSVHDVPAAHALYGAPVFGTKPTSVSGAPAAVSTSHGASTSVTNVHAAPAVSTPAIGTLQTSVVGIPTLGTAHASPTDTTTKTDASAATTVQSSPADASKVTTTTAYPAPVVPTYQDPSAYPVYYNPQPAFNPYYQPFPFVNAGGASGSKTVYELPYVQSVYQPPQSNAGYYQPFPYSGYVPGFGRPSTYPTSQVFPAYSASPATEAHHTGSVTAMKDPSVTKSTMIGNYQASPVASLMYRDSAPAVSGDHMTPGVATAHNTYQAAPGTVMVHSTPRHNDCTLSSSRECCFAHLHGCSRSWFPSHRSSCGLHLPGG